MTGERVLTDLLGAFDIVALERQALGRFRVLTGLPDWFAKIYPQAESGQEGFEPGQAFHYLANFLLDAEAYWRDYSSGFLRSGPWVEADPAGHPWRLEATAVSAAEKKLLLIAWLGATTEEKQTLLQKARETSLLHDLLVKAEKKRSEAEARLELSFAELRKSHQDLISILNQLRLGTAITDQEGRVSFLSQACHQFVRTDADDILGKPWEEMAAFSDRDRIEIGALLKRPQSQRRKVPVSVRGPGGQRFWMEIEVHDDPRNPLQKIFLFYDLTEIHDLRRLLDQKTSFHGMVGQSQAMQRVFEEIRDVAPVDWTVLIEGETGAGKELAARAIHALSPRADKPFIAVNCAGLTESVLTSQLFGHKRGAFTGAVADHQGLIEASHGGTLFLDEIGDIPIGIQTTLLRVLQEKEITRLGESRPRKVDLRVLVATHRNLAEEVEKGRFRSDLLYRIRVARIQLPPLRDRVEDMPLLIELFLGQARAATGKPVEEISHEARRILMDFAWPGNVRELKSAIEYAVIRSKSQVIQPNDLPAELTGEIDTPGLPCDEKGRLLRVIRQAKGNRSLAARMLGIGRSTLYRRLAELEIDLEQVEG